MAEEEPIIVSGGSVTIEFKDNFREDPPSSSRKKYKKDGARLSKIVIKNKQEIPLDEKDEVWIVYTI